VYRIVDYVDSDGKDVYREWYRRLRDSKAKAAMERRMVRIESGNVGDHKYCRDGVWELRVDVGAGYRIYYGRMGVEIVLLLCGGDKSSQSQDIERAVGYWKSAQKETK
jgi:putative addiction module killer protein